MASRIAISLKRSSDKVYGLLRPGMSISNAVWYKKAEFRDQHLKTMCPIGQRFSLFLEKDQGDIRILFTEEQLKLLHRK
jgi:hypothetical protein